MSKKILLGVFIALLVLGVGAAGYKYFSGQNPVQNTEGGAAMKNSSQGSAPAVIQGVDVNGGNVQGISVCKDQCGDGICQVTDKTCTPGDLSCICAETKQDCPQDCR